MERLRNYLEAVVRGVRRAMPIVQRVLKSYPALTVWRVVLLYIVLMLCRAAFVYSNADAFGEFTRGEIPDLIIGSLRFDTVSILYVNGPWLLLALLPFHFRERRWYRRMLFWLYFVVNTLCIVVTNLGDAVYFHYTHKRFTAEEIFFAGNDNSVQLVGKFMLENWPIVIYGLGLIALLFFGYLRKVQPVAVARRAYYYLVSVAVLVGAIALSVGGIRGGFSRMVRPIAVPVAMQYAKSAEKAHIVLSNPFCIIRTLALGPLKVPHYFDEEELKTIYEPYHDPVAEPKVNLQGRNVVIFVLESFSAEHSAHLRPDLYADGKGYTPFLDSLMADGYTFRRMYSCGKRSIQALPTIWSSIPSLKQPFMLMTESMGDTRPLPRILVDRGYSSAFFCGSDHGSMGFGAYARAAGFERNYSREDYEAAHGKGDFDGYWGIWDDRFLSFMGEELDDMRQPFVASVFTLQSHHPFVVPSRCASSLPSGHTKAHRCVAYTDSAIRGFFDENRDKPWFRNTIFVFVADHVSSEKYDSKSRISPADLHIVGAIYTPDGALRGEYTKAASQCDIMPTLLGMLGNTERYFAYGRDLLNEQVEARIVTHDFYYQVITDEYLYLFDENEIVKIYALDDVERSANLVGRHDKSEVERYVKAFVQQYYTHAKRRSYVAPEREPEPSGNMVE